MCACMHAHLYICMLFVLAYVCLAPFPHSSVSAARVFAWCPGTVLAQTYVN